MAPSSVASPGVCGEWGSAPALAHMSACWWRAGTAGGQQRTHGSGSVPVLERWTEEVSVRTRECGTVAEVIDSLKKENDRLRVINYQLKAKCEAKGASLTVGRECESLAAEKREGPKLRS